MKKRLAAISLAAILLVATAGCQNKDASVVATMGDNKVTMEDYTFFFRIMQNNQEYSARTQYGFTDETMAEYWNLDMGSGPIKDAIAPQALGTAQQYCILYNAAVAAGIEADTAMNEESDGMVDSMLEELDNDVAAFEETYQVNPDKMREMYHRFDLVEAYRMDLLAKVQVTEEDAKEAFENNKEQYETATVRHVLIKSDDTMSDEEKAEAKTKAEDILQQIKDGADIGKLAAEHSDDGGSATNNGEYTFQRGMMVTEFEDWAFSAKPGDKDIVQTTYGYHVMQMISLSTFEDLKDSIIENLREEKASDELNTLVNEAGDEWELNDELIDSLSVFDGKEYTDTPASASEEAAPAESAAESPAESAASSAAESSAPESAEESASEGESSSEESAA